MRGLVAELDGYANAIHARTGKRLRKDTAHMLAGVLSYPDDAPKDRYPEWRARSIKWLKNGMAAIWWPCWSTWMKTIHISIFTPSNRRA